MWNNSIIVEETKGPLDVENLINAVQNVAAVVCSQLQQQGIGCSKGLSPFDVRFNPSIVVFFYDDLTSLQTQHQLLRQVNLYMWLILR